MTPAAPGREGEVIALLSVWKEIADACIVKIRAFRGHDDLCESEFISPHGYTPCACDQRKAYDLLRNLRIEQAVEERRKEQT